MLTLTIVSCDRIKNKGHELADKAEEKVRNKSKDVINKAFPFFDSYKADTKFNKERFKEFLQVDLTTDVKNIFCFDDPIGIDQDFQFSFNCDTSTVRRIIAKHKLTLNTKATDIDYGFGMQNDFDWWDKNKIKNLQLYSWEGTNRFYKYFWYDTNEQKAYYFEFDM